MIEAKASVFLKVSVPMLVTLAGMLMLERVVQPQKQPVPIVVRLEGRVIEFNAVQV